MTIRIYELQHHSYINTLERSKKKNILNFEIMATSIIEFLSVVSKSSARHEEPSFLGPRFSLLCSKLFATFPYLTKDKSRSGLIQFLSDLFEYKLTDITIKALQETRLCL